jgi:hypothetical protein
LTLGAIRRLADLLDRWQEKPDQNGDDGDHHQQFDQGKGRPSNATHEKPSRLGKLVRAA